MTATLTAGDKAVYDTETITVTDASRPWDGAETGEPYTISSTQTWTSGYSISPAADVDWFKFYTSSSSTSYYIIHWQDSLDYLTSAYGCDVKVSVYNADGDLLGGPQDYGCWESSGSQDSYGSTDGIRIAFEDNDYSANEYIYIKVQGYFSSSTGTYSLYIY